MSSRSFSKGISEFFGLVGSAIAVSSATREHRRAHDSDLKRLGIDPEQFHAIKRY